MSDVGYDDVTFKDGSWGFEDPYDMGRFDGLLTEHEARIARMLFIQFENGDYPFRNHEADELKNGGRWKEWAQEEMEVYLAKQAKSEQPV